MVRSIFSHPSLIKKIATTSLFFLIQFSRLQAQQGHFDFCNTLPCEMINISSDVHFLQLKKRVIAELQNSWCTLQKIDLMMELIYQIKPEICVEIGVFRGSSLLPVSATLKYLRKGHVYAIDSWSNQEIVKYINDDDPNREWWSKIDMKEAKKACQALIAKWELQSFCSLMHMTSSAAAKQLPEIDFLHLDGNFSKEGSLSDVELYLPKVKSGGYILLSNLYFKLNGEYSKMPSMWRLFDECEIVWNADYNCALFRKN
jgi:cephalosporin hydroxylase